jgi:large subunit ribosomal protein L6
MRAIESAKSIKIPDGIEVKVDGRIIVVKGGKGVLTRDFSAASVYIGLDENNVLIRANWPRKREAALVGTVCSHIQNMIIGVTKGFTYKLKIVFSHFPISVKVREKTLAIENFTGERSPRIVKIVGDTKVTVKDEDVIVQGTNIENVSQTAANIETATRIKVKDPRIFLDGIYIYERREGMEG